MASRSAFGGGDQTYLRDVQYGDGRKLDARANLHVSYATSATSFPQFESELIDWRPDTTVLECGCGTGRFWVDGNVPRTMRAVVTDLSPGMVDEALASARSAGFESVTGRTCDVQELPFDDDEFDVVLANHMLYHVPDPDRAIGELARVVSRTVWCSPRPTGTATCVRSTKRWATCSAIAARGCTRCSASTQANDGCANGSDRSCGTRSTTTWSSTIRRL